MTKSIRRFRSISLFQAGICTLLLGCGFPLPAQSIHVYTELQRVDPFGNVIQQDLGPESDRRSSREVLSPALVRNASSSFLVAVQPPPGIPYWFYLGENPENLIRVTVYKAIFEKTAAGAFVPDRLEKIELPYNGLVPERNIPGQTTELFLVDVFVPKEAVVRRMKLEPQMWIPDRWIIYPMEVRIVPQQVLAKAPDKGVLAPLASPADATYRGVFLSYFCEKPEKSEGTGPLTIRSLILRNARRDAILAAPLGRSEIGTFLGYEGDADWCRAEPVVRHPERVLRIRDRLLREKP
ncbi:MAG: hypothetical protein JST65_24465 [Acidobacteria bacterium]|nr:hypothetical protein [Acidobacteriota bacterium]